MKMRTLVAAVLAAGLAVSGFAALSTELSDWGNGPVQFLMTKEEAAQWKTLTTDDQAKAFIALFWARRDPTPATPQNEFKADFDARVTAADQYFAEGTLRGAMTDRGKALILYGKPAKMVRIANPAAIAPSEGSTAPDRDTSNTVEWQYEGDAAKTMFGAARATIRFTDRTGNNEFKVDRGSADLKSAQQRTIEHAIVNPNLTAAPSFAAPPQQQPVPAAPAAAAVQTELTTESLETAVNEFKAAAKNPYDKTIYATTGEYVTPSGETFVPVMLYIPKAAGLNASSSLTYFGVVQDESGKNVLAFEQPAKLTESKGDFYVDRSLRLGAGKHHAIFGLADNGKPVAMVATDMDLAGTIDKEATAISQLTLSNNIYPLTVAQAPDDPFAFGGVKVVPKADKTYTKADDLWYFFELRNPGLVESADTVPVSGGDSAAQPKVQVKIDVEGTDTTGKKVKMSAPPTEAAAIAMKGVPGHYGVGSAIPLASFKPGDYTFTIKVIDTVKKASYTLKDNFKVVE